MDNKRNNIHLIYSALKSEGYTDIGSEDNFARKMQDEGNRKKVFSSLQSSGYSDIGRDYNSFSNLVYTAPKPVASNTTAPIPQVAPKQQPQRRTATAQQQTIKPTINIPTVPQMWEQSQKQAKEALTPMFEQEVSIDKKGNKVRKPKLMPSFDPDNGGIAAPPVYRDMMSGNEYSKDDVKKDERLKRGINNSTYTVPLDVKGANREQVKNLSENIDKPLDDAYKRAQNEYDDAKHTWWQDMLHTLADASHGAGPIQTDSPYETLVKSDTDVMALHAAQRSLKNAQRTIAEADHNAKSGSFGKWLESSFAGGAARGLGQKLFDLSTWDMGTSDLEDNGELMIALDKFDSGKPLSKSQQMLLDAKATELATDAYFGSYVGRGYKAGGVTAESIPFMIEFCLNPASATGSAAANKMARYAVKRFGKQVLKNNAKKYVASKVATRVAGDVVGSVVMAATTGSIHTIADAEDRMNGQVQFGKKENGETEFSGHTKGVDAGTALGQAFVNQTIQNQSEMVGNYFAPALGVVGKGITKGLNKIGAGKVTKFMDDVAMSDVGRMVSDFEKHSQWNGPIGEYAEEVVGNVENALLVGDQTLDTKEGTGVFNLEQNIDTFLGVSLMGGFLSGVKTLGYRTPKYKARKTMVNTSNNAAKIFGNDETWGGIRNTLSFGNEDDVKQTIIDVLTNPDYNDEQKLAALEYAKSVETYKGMLRSEEKRRTDADADPIQNDAETSYDNGYSLETDQEMNDAKNMLDFKSQQFKHIFGIPEDEEIGSKFGDGVDALKQMDSDGMLDSEEKKKAAVDYLNAKATYDGMINHIQDDLDEKISASDTTIDGNANLDDGQIHPATMKLENRKVYVVGGNLVMNEDGTMIDADKSDESIIVRDADTGNIEFTDPRSVLSIDEAIDPAKEKEIAQQQIREQYAQQAADKIDGVLPFNIGDTYTLMDDTGTQHTYKILMDNGDGNVTVSIDGNEEQPFVVQKSAVQDMQENTSLSRLQQYEQDKAQQQIAEKQQQEEVSRPAYNLNDEIAIHDENGNIVRGSVTANENDDGQIEVYSESPINGKKVNVFTREELDAINANNEEIAQETPVSVQNPQEISQEEPILAQNEENLPQSEKQPMPMVGEGENAEPDFYNVEPKRARDYIYEETGLSRDEANGFVKANEDASAKALDKAKKSQPKIGTSISKYNKEKSEWQKKVDEAQRVADYWKNVKDAQRSVYSQEESVRKQKQAEATEKAIEEDKQFRAEQAKKAEEQALIGTNNVSPAIRDKWNNAPKIDGAANEIVLPNGEKVAGHYILAESGAASPSHNATAEFAKTEGFPIDDNDQSVNDRDYERDQDAQTITREMAGNYDSRAMQTPVVVSNDGVVLSGNGRTMAGELAARDNTDGAYIEHLKKYPQKYGFTEEQVAGMKHPRVLFVPDDAMPYTSDTFSKFNQQEMKGQSKKEHAVKMGKIVDDATYNRIIISINRYDTLGEFYADTAASTEAIKDLLNAGAISSAQMTEMFDGDTISSQAKELLENVLIGKAFESNPDAIRQITKYKSMRQSIITALGEISNNQLLGEDYNLEDELSAAIDLVYQARNSGIKSGGPASFYARQGNLFQLDDGATVADYTNATVMMLADIINDNRVTLLKKYLALYNERAKISAIGQIDMFTGTIESKKDIIQSVNNFFKNATNSEQQEAIDKAVEQRKTESVQQNGDSDSVDERPEETGKSETAEAIAEAEQSTETNPTDAQKEAGNYKKGHVQIGRFDITVENPKGSERSGKDANGTPWSITMQNTYGYIRGTEGVDGDHIDVFIADDFGAWNGRKIFVVDQYNEDDTFDEHKVMLGFNDIDEAESAYYANYSPDWKERHPANMVTAVNAEDFEKWIDSSKRKTKAFADYANVKTDHISDATKMVDKKDVGVSKTETTTSSKKNAGFSIDKRFHKKNGTYIYAVNFTERVDKEAFKELKSRVKDFGGYYSSFGKGGFIFDSEEDAKKFADAVMDKSGESIEDSRPLSLQDVQKATGEVESKQVKEEKEDLFQKAERISKEHTTEEKPKNEGTLGLVSDERMAELKERLRKKLGGQLNVGIDPEILAIGMELAAGHIDRGVKKFADFAKVMVDDLGDVIRPYLKAFYNGARDLPEITDNGLSAEMTPYDDVRTFDVANFDKETPNVIAKAEEITNEVVIDKQTSTARNELTNNRNQNRRKENEQTTADTEAITSETEIVASKAESDIETSTEENQLNKVVATIDKQVETVNKQLALLGYYEADENSPFDESYGYMRSAEKKAVKDADTLAKRLVEELGIDPETIVDKKGKKRKNIAQANIAPAGGDVSIRLPLTAERDLYINISLKPDYESGGVHSDNLNIDHIYFRIENPEASGYNQYVGRNVWIGKDSTYQELIKNINSEITSLVPDFNPTNESVSQSAKKTSKTNMSKKKVVSSKQTTDDLFGGLFDNINDNNIDNGQKETNRASQTVVSKQPDNRLGNDEARTDGGIRSNGTEQPVGERNTGNGTGADGRRNEDGSRSDEETGRHESVRNQRDTKERTSGEVRLSDGTGVQHGRTNRQSDEQSKTDGGREGVSKGESSTVIGSGTVSKKKASNPQPKFTNNYVYPEDASEIDNYTKSQRLAANVKALEVLRNLLRDGRQATDEEREILGRFRGWGGVELGRSYSTNMMRQERNSDIQALADIIDEFDPQGKKGILEAINRAALSSYYTPTPIAKGINRFLELAGYKGGNMLDPSMGNGIFEGTMPVGIQQRTAISGIELDWLTGQIAQHLYPDANVRINGFEAANVAPNSFDVVESNIPFGNFGVNDKDWKNDNTPVRKSAQARIHNYFAVKMIEATKAGGLCTIMTSNAILDTKGNQIIRDYIADQCEILGVVRLPDNTFKGAGTGVVTDVIFLRKYKDEADRNGTHSNGNYVEKIESPFLHTAETELINKSEGKSYKVSHNGYFASNPQMIIGEQEAGGQYRKDQYGLTSNLTTDEIGEKLNSIIEKDIVGKRKGKLFNTSKDTRETYQAVRESYTGDGNYVSNGNLVEQNGKYGILEAERGKYGDVTRTFTELPNLRSKADRINAMLPLRNAMKRLISEEINGSENKTLDAIRKELKEAYDSYVKKFGKLGEKDNDYLELDIDGFGIRALEKWKGGKYLGLSDIFTKNTIKPALDITQAKTPTDAISVCLSEYGEIRSDFMENVLGESWQEQCGDALFKVPFMPDTFETKDSYLSGDVKTKLNDAKKAAEQDDTYKDNVKALEEVQPKEIGFTDINIRMGARWVPVDIYSDFLKEMFGIANWRAKSGVAYSPEADVFTVNINSGELGGRSEEWKTERRSASEVFEAALKDKTLTVWDTVKDGNSETKVVNKEQTELVNGKIQDLRMAFEDWLPRDNERVQKLTSIYNDMFNRTVLRKFDGSHLNVPGLMGMELRPHQKDAVWMLINNRGGIVDHIVGAGKTLVMQSAIMEMRRMGIAKKPMIVALKSTVAQIAKEFKEAYPAARVLSPTEKDFQKTNRKKFLSNIALNDYDCVVLSHEQYCMLAHSEEVETQVINEQLAQLDNAIEFLYGQDDKSNLTKKQIKGLEKRKANLEAKLGKLLDRKVDREFTFENLGVDYLFVDECQAFKSLPYVTSYQNIAGLGDAKGSEKAVALLNGIRYLQKLHQGDMGTVFLSGTTITNSLVEIYNLMQYLRPREMARLGLNTFDAWASQFAVRSSELEYGVTNELKEKNRFRNFDNVPELAKMYAEIADVRNDLNLKLPKPKPQMHIVTVPESDSLSEINSAVVGMVKNKDGSYFGLTTNERSPFGLLASTISAKAAISTKLIDPDLDDSEGKVKYVCENVKKIYDKFAKQKGTQLIFCDTGVPVKGKPYDAYTDIINRLVNEYGIPREEIVDIHVADTDVKRKALFEKVNEGKVRILIGGTKNMGTGVNVQKRITAMHHVDVPWTPADREQREGRGVRQGNEIARDFNGNNVDIFFYATEGSLDMYKYQLQDTKGKMFAQFKSGTVGERNFDEGNADESGGFDPAEIVALLSGNPVIFEKSKQDKLVEKLRRAKRAYESDWQRRKSKFDELTERKNKYDRLVQMNARDIEALERGGFAPDENGTYPSNVTISVVGNYGYESQKTFDKPKEAGAYIHKLLALGKKVELSGFGMKAKIGVEEGEDGLFGKRTIDLDAPSGIKYSSALSEDDTAAGLAFRNVLNKVLTNKNTYERNLEDTIRQLDGADPKENVFPKQAELDKAVEEKKRLDEEYKKLSDEKDDNKSIEPTETEDSNRYSLREEPEPKRKGVGYKAFFLKDGKLYPPMVANKGGEATPYGIWLNADAANVSRTTDSGRNKVKAGGKGTQGGSGELAYRPGWHLGTIPFALQFNRGEKVDNPFGMLNKDGEVIQVGKYFPKDFVWAEVEYADDVNYQKDAEKYGRNDNGTFVHSLAGLPYLPKDGSYKYRTNPNPATDPWVITGAMRIKRLLKPSEVDKLVSESGRKPQIREDGAVSDSDIEKLNKQLEPETIAETATQTAKSLGTKIRIVNDVNTITDEDPKKQERMRRAKGWYDTKTGEVVIVVSNNRNVGEVQETVLHEVVAHKGLRELFGKHFDTFLYNVYANATKGLRDKINNLAAQKGWDIPLATEEYMAKLAENTEFADAEKTGWWSKIKNFFIDMLVQAGVTLKKKISDNELRYILWKSYKHLSEPNQYVSINVAEDTVMQKNLGVGRFKEDKLFSDGDPIEKDRVSVRDSYERELASSLYQFQEAMQDSMLGLKTLMDKIEKATGHKIADYENAYMTENAMSSKSKAEADVYKNMLMKPLIETLSDLKKKGATQQEITDYMMAKHGLERNVVMAGRNAKTAFDEYQKTTPNGNKTLQDFIDSYRENDYAGLTALTGEKEVVDAELAAQQMVDSFETNFPTDELWVKTNACTKATLSKLYESGILDKDTYEGVRDMYENYIPLRGWDEKTSDEVYGYLTDKSGPMNGSIMKKAEGRKSKADDPIATIAAMAESGISQGNRNLMKQRFLNLVLNNPSDAVSVNSLWLKHNEITDEWNPVFPDNIEDNDTAAEVEQKVKDFEEKMEQLSESAPDMYKHGKDTVGIPYIVKDQNRREHQVLVKRNGRTYVLTINGNPRAAQALNGLSNPDVEMKGAIGNILKAGEYINRQMSAFYTTRNPNFIASNFIRDALYANSMVWVKEKPNYALRYHRNFGKVNPKRLKSLLSKHENGTLDMSKPIERLFHQFMMNGGETGYTVQRDIDKHKQAIKKELSVMGDNIPVRKAINILGEKFDDLNRAVENCARFAAFVTSRQMGRSIDRSIYDAKEISVNFNKKGSGAKFLGTNGQTKLGNIGAFVSGGGRIGYVFWNAAIQGTFNAGKAIKNHPAKGIGMLAATFLLGALVPALAGDGDGDDDKNYYNLPDFVRRSNICFRIGDKWITIPLSVEMRAMYGMGELATSVMSGNEKLSAGEISRKIAEQISQTLPLDFMEGDGGLSAMIPSSVKPLWEAHTNKDWTGLPLYKDTQFNKNMPEWTKAYNRTNKLMVKLSEESNRVSGGDKYTKGWADWNPAIIEHLLEGAFGGVTTTINQMVKTGETISGERDFDWRNIPIASRVVKNADERTQMRNVNEKYFKYVDEYNRTKQRINGYEEEADNGSLEYAEKIDFLNNSPEFRRYEIMEDYISDIRSLNEDIKDAESDEERKTYQDEQNELKKEMLEAIMESGGNK